MQRIHCTSHADACQTKTISYCVDGTVDLTEVFCVFQRIDIGKEFDSKQYSARKMKNKVEENKIILPTCPFLSSPQLSLNIIIFFKGEEGRKNIRYCLSCMCSH